VRVVTLTSLRRTWYVGAFLLLWTASIPIAEAAFRWLGDQPSLDLEGLFVSSSGSSYKLASGVDTQATWAAGRFTVHTDGLGLRCDEHRLLAVKPGDRLDVLFLGDSQGFGHGVSFVDSVAGSAAELAAREGYRFANASVGGHAALNQFALARWLAEEQRVVASNYVLLMGPLMINNTDGFTRATVGDDGRLYDRPPRAWAKIGLWAKTNLVVYGRLRDAIRNLGVGGRPQEDRQALLRLYGAGEPEEEVRRKLVRFLREVQQFAARRGAGVRVVYLPMTVEVDLEVMRRAAAVSGVNVDLDLPRRIGRAAARELGISFHDLGPVLERVHSEGDPLRLKGDFHYNPVLSRACGLSIWQDLAAVMRQ